MPERPAILSRFSAVRRSGDGYAARCPARDDRRASLSVGTGDDGRVLLRCHAGCSIDAILSAINLKRSDLFPERPSGNGSCSRIVATYDYCDERGEPQYQVVRFEAKAFRQRRADGNGGFIWSTKGPEVAAWMAERAEAW